MTATSAKKPWNSEPDFEVFEYEGFTCIVRRNDLHGALCGYVVIPEGHPWHDKLYWHIDAKVHGGLTYSGKQLNADGTWATKKNPGFMVGFDCSHGDDYVPNSPMNFVDESEYRDIEYVKEQVHQLVRQAKLAAG